MSQSAPITELATEVGSELAVEAPAASTIAAPFKLGHRPELDGVRGISILLVLLLHLGVATVPGGFLGVDIFFVLSGFLITSLLVQEWDQKGSISIKDFYIRRALRLMPALVTLMIGTGLYAVFFLNKEQAGVVYQGILLTLSYVSNWIFALYPSVIVGPLGITWSLAIEEQFYLVWPILLSLALKLRLSRRTILITLVLAVVAVAIHRRTLFASGAVVTRLYYATDTRADALLIGCLTALVLSWNLVPRSEYLRPVMRAIALVAAAFVGYLAATSAMQDAVLYRGFFTLVSLAIGTVLIVLMLWPSRSVLWLLRFPPLRWIGRVSYGLYLWHWPVREFVCPDITKCSTPRIFAAAVIAIAITALSFYFIEKPFLRLKQRFAVG